MNKILSLLLLTSFILWILPLGFFIKPSQEKNLCDGQRAICMCHVIIFKSSEKAAQPGINLNAGSSASKDNASGGGANEFISSRTIISLQSPVSSYFENQDFAYKSPYLAALEYVPKI